MKIFQIDLGEKNAAISVIFTMDVIFFAFWVAFGIRGLHPDMDEKLWTLFFASNQALFLILNSAAKKEAGVDVPPDNTTKTTVQQSVTATTTSVPPKEGE